MTAAADKPLSAQAVAELLGVSRATVYRWLEEGRIPRVWTRATIDPLRGVARPLKQQPKPTSARYGERYRHRFPAERVVERARPFLDYDSSSSK